jgi:hypothetical protein
VFLAKAPGNGGFFVGSGDGRKDTKENEDTKETEDTNEETKELES